MHKWEFVFQDEINQICRFEVPGGWLYRVTTYGLDTVVFVPKSKGTE